ncbi:MAG TPA: ParB/RepB/Spo0J family partition protein [Magnetospirillum sp.]|nr:ParB/RepB/Spo0J family partition protein [Magnetospirillum sp.]
MNQDATIPAPVEPEEASLDEVEFEPSALLAKLKAQAAAEPVPEVLPDHLPISAIATETALFQPRGLAENHVHDLTRVAKSGRLFDPLVVIQIGGTAYLVDGHHRREAYLNAKVTQPIPVTYFAGSVEEAVLEAGRANSKAKQPMTNTERQDFAWRLVRLGTYTRAQVAEAAGVSVRQVATMRDALKQLGEDAFEHESWWKARQAASGKESPSFDSDDEREEWLEARASDLARRMRKEFTGKLISNPELAARALNIYFGRKLPAVFHELRQYVSDVEAQAEENDDF